MYYYLYQITNKVNGKIYVGVHKTKSLDDGYMGSGKVIKRSIAKYGAENFTKDILEFFENAELMYAKEKEIVTDEFLLREDTYNIRRGGTGGFDFINKTGLNHKGYVSIQDKNKKISPFVEGHKYGSIGGSHRQQLHPTQSKEIALRGHKNGTFGFKNRTHSAETIIKMSKSKNVGIQNSQFGTFWVTNGVDNKKLIRDSIIPSGWYRGRAYDRIRYGDKPMHSNLPT
jgi:hypothetical protein